MLRLSYKEFNASLDKIWCSGLPSGFFPPMPTFCSPYSREPSLSQGEALGRTATHPLLTGNHNSPPTCLHTATGDCLLVIAVEEADSIEKGLEMSGFTLQWERKNMKEL